jgi:hypothetical protein
MKPLSQQLENESLLLLYMAGELPPTDREELEVMLARDAGLRSQLKLLQSAQGATFAGLARLDAGEPLQSPEPAMRQIDRSMKQWWIDQQARPALAPATRSMIPVIGWSVGTAVAALLVFCIWWGFHSTDTSHYADTQPSINSPAGGGSLADGGSSSADSPDNASPQNTSTDPKAVQVVTVDSSPQRLGELESVVSEDFTRE